jgi:hypothetical protein
MSEKCISPAEMGGLLAASADDPRWVHVNQCPGCRTLAASYRAFLDGNPALADSDADAELDRRLAAEIQLQPTVVGKTRSWRGPIFGASLAMAAVLATIVILTGRPMAPNSHSIVIRGQQSPEGTVMATHPVQVLPGGKLRLTWSPVPEIETYAVRLVAGDLAEKDRWIVEADTVLTIRMPAGMSPGGAGGDLYWQVEALQSGGIAARSGLTALQLP